MSSPTTPAWPGQVLVKVLTEPAFDDRVHLLIDEHIEGAIEAGLVDVTLDLDTRVDEAIAAQGVITSGQIAELDTRIAEVDTRIDALPTPADVDNQITNAVNTLDLVTLPEVDARIAAIDLLTPAEVDVQIDAKIAELPDGGGGGGGSITRQVATVTTAVLAGGQEAQLTLPLAISYSLLGIRTSVPARVRVYPGADYASADATRPVTQEPPADRVLVLEYVTASALTYPLSPAVSGASVEDPPTAEAVVRIANLSSSSASVSLSLTYLALES